jgi:hypothetical protein
LYAKFKASTLACGKGAGTDGYSIMIWGDNFPPIINYGRTSNSERGDREVDELGID